MKREIITIENGVVSIPATTEIWMTRHELADLFGCFVAKVNTNIRAILKAGLLDETQACWTYRYWDDGSVEHYSLEMITALAFRIRSRNADLLRKWLMARAIRFHRPATDSCGRRLEREDVSELKNMGSH